MSIKITKLTNEQFVPFRNIFASMGSSATVSVQGTYPYELVNCGINPRGIQNKLLGYIVTQPSGSQIAVETVFYDPKDGHDNGDLHVINSKSKEITSYYQGWGTWVDYYGNKHWEYKGYLRTGTISPVNFGSTK